MWADVFQPFAIIDWTMKKPGQGPALQLAPACQVWRYFTSCCQIASVGAAWFSE